LVRSASVRKGSSSKNSFLQKIFIPAGGGRSVRNWIPAIIGLLLAGYGIFSALAFGSQVWYSFFVVGGTIFLLNLGKSKVDGCKKFLKTYALYLVATAGIELVGRQLLGLWYYPSFGLPEMMIHVFMIGYPFAFFMAGETYRLLNGIFSPGIAFFITSFLSAFLHELPNTFAWEWIYTVPYVTFEILKINIIVIAGWPILIAVPILTEKILEKTK